MVEGLKFTYGSRVIITGDDFYKNIKGVIVGYKTSNLPHPYANRDTIYYLIKLEDREIYLHEDKIVSNENV